MNSLATIFFLLILIGQSFITLAQDRTNNWYFGLGAGLNFTNCEPNVLTNGKTVNFEGLSTISDAQGNLLFYTDGITVWNRQHAIMQNGTGLLSGISSTQAALIVPMPGSTQFYYVFTVAEELELYGLRYSVVDMNLAGGLGAVTDKNIYLNEGHEKLTAVRHANGIDVWIINRAFNSANYYSRLLTASGVSATPVISLSPNFLGNSWEISRGCLKASNNGKMLFCALYNHPFSEMSKFDNATGQVYDFIKFSNFPRGVNPIVIAGSYGAEFSPDNKLLYVTVRTSPVSQCPTCHNSYLNQYNVVNFDSASIANSSVLIDSGGSIISPGLVDYWALQLAKNGRIYVAKFDYYIGVINNPNVRGTGCNFNPLGVNLFPKKCRLGLPGFIQTDFDPHYRTYEYSYSEGCNRTVSFSLNGTQPYDSLRWDFGDPSSGAANSSLLPAPVHTFSSTGPKQVKLLLFNRYGCENRVDTILKEITIGLNGPNLGSDRGLCTGDSIVLNASVSGASSYLWNNGSQASTIKIFAPGIYWCDVRNAGCTFRDSIIITGIPLPVVNLGSDTTLCEGNTLLLDASQSNCNYLWQDGTVLPNFSVSAAGKYWVQLTKNGCIKRDTLQIWYKLKPVFSLGQDQLICQGKQVILSPVLENEWQLLWSDGSNLPRLLVTSPGLFSLTATNNCGSYRDEVSVDKGICKVHVPSSFTPNDDGKNDLLRPLGTENVNSLLFKVYNRYGQLVFTSIDRNKGWNGTISGLPQAQGNYVWLLNYTDNNGRQEQLKGSVLLLR